jgi:hypothetical protein
MLIGSGLQALTTLGKFKPAVLGEIQAAGDIQSTRMVAIFQPLVDQQLFSRQRKSDFGPRLADGCDLLHA